MNKKIFQKIFVSIFSVALILIFTNTSRVRNIAKTYLLNVFRILNSIENSNYPNLSVSDATYMLMDQNIALTNKLIFKHKEPIYIFIRSTEGAQIKGFPEGKPEQILFNLSSKILNNKKILEYNLKSGFPLDEFQKIKLEVPENHYGWIQIVVSYPNLENYIPIFISKLEGNKILFVESTDTLKAYGRNHYLWHKYNLPDALGGVFVRPYEYPIDYKIIDFSSEKIRMDKNLCYSHLINADFQLRKNLDKNNYKYDISSDNFLDNFSNIKDYKLIIFGTHNEYWTSAKVKNVADYIDSGGNVLFLGGNTAWRSIERYPSYEKIWGKASLEKNTEGLKFRNKYLGSYFSGNGYFTWAPFKVNTNLEQLDKKLFPSLTKVKTFGKGSDFKNCRRFIKGASGHETDKLINTQDFSLLAKGSNPNKGGSHIVYKEFTSGGSVLNFGTLALWHKTKDEIINHLINVFINKSIFD